MRRPRPRRLLKRRLLKRRLLKRRLLKRRHLLRRLGTRWCCKRSSATTSALCPTFPTAREEEAVGIVSGAWMGGMKGAVLMQTSGFATLANVLASLAIPYQIPLIMFVSERGTLGEFNYGQSLVCRTMRPVLDSLAMEHHTVTRLDEFEFIVDRSIKQAITPQAPVALILSPLLTGGKVFDK